MSTFDTKTLDAILALQLTVGWAGEKAEDPKRLGWWNTDLTDAMAGGDLFSRLVPRTAVWVGFELARQAALRADRRARSKLAHPDQVWTLFHFGFELDEALADRLEHHKRHTSNPASVFGQIWGVQESFQRPSLEHFLGRLGQAPVEETPAGRRLKKMPTEPLEAARALAAALLPLDESYPLPHGSAPSRASEPARGAAGGAA
jgi:hypothetical protein